MLEQLEPVVIAFFSFFFVAIAARFIGKQFSKYGLPYITGYLLAGMVAGPFILGLMSNEDATRLRFIDELSLAVIAFIAGSELYLKELRSRLRPIALNLGGIVLVAPVLIGISVYVATDFISFTQDLPVMSRLAIALLGATILMALSPASTIAVIQEVRARGDFTRTTLSITVVMDVVIIVLFAISAAIAAALLEGTGFSGAFALALVIDLVIALVAGIAVGKLLEVVLSAAVHRLLKTALVLAIGLAIFVIAFQVTDYTKALGFELHLEPLLISMIAGFYVTNFTRYRDPFDEILHDVSPIVYVAFFTLTGVALKLDILLATGAIAVILFLVRILSIFLGSYLGGTLAGEPPRFKRFAWMGLITQAGIALGLAREVAVEFPNLGDAFATLIISVVVLNEIFGPLLLKTALRRVGEAHTPETATPDTIRDAVVLGAEAQSVALARQLQSHGWQVKLLDTEPEHVERFTNGDIKVHHLGTLDKHGLSETVKPGTDAVIAMSDNDGMNLDFLTTAYEDFGVKRLVVRLNNLSQADDFRDLGAMIVNPAAAMVNVLDQAVRAPQSAALLMHEDDEYDVTQVTITNKDIEGLLVRDLRLPSDILILEIARNGHSIVPNGYTQVHCRDEITLLGSPESLKSVTSRLGY
jgi:Trk K+ transport system NAD-binding subunit/Kef-type K+ transport system membrane component KefB